MFLILLPNTYFSDPGAQQVVYYDSATSYSSPSSAYQLSKSHRVCPACKAIFADEYHLSYHVSHECGQVKQVTNIPEMNANTVPKNLTCTNCRKLFRNEFTLLKHLKSKTCLKSKTSLDTFVVFFECPKCPQRSYTSQGYLDNHMKRDHGYD